MRLLHSVFFNVLVLTFLTTCAVSVSAQQTALPELTDIKLVDKTPSFPGGRNELNAFIAKTLVYPEEPKRNRTTGTIPVEFIIDQNGNILQPKNIGDTEIDNRLIKEAIRVIKAMPQWTPAEYKGQKVACKMVVPVAFEINE